VISEPTSLSSWVQFTKDDIMRGIELLVMTVLGLIVMLFVVRPLVRRVITSDQAAIAVADIPALGLEASTAIGAAPPAPPIQAVPSQTARMIDMAQVQGQVHAQSIQKVGELASRNPNETVSIIREWLQDTPA
jgi:flagellar M-ring protein FliF